MLSINTQGRSIRKRSSRKAATSMNILHFARLLDLTPNLCLCALMIIAAFGFVSHSYAAKHREIEVSWSELSSYVTGQKVMIAALSGAMVEGRVTSVEPDGLVMNVTKTSDESKVAKGSQQIPRSQVTVIQLKTVEGSSRMLGAAIGAGGGAVGGWGIGEGVFHSSGEGTGAEAAVWMLGMGAGGAAVGYLVGRNADTTITYLKIRP